MKLLSFNADLAFSDTLVVPSFCGVNHLFFRKSNLRGYLLYLVWLVDHLCDDANSSFNQFLPLDV